MLEIPRRNVEVLWRAYASKLLEHDKTAAAVFFAATYTIGRMRGSRWIWSELDRGRVRALLETEGIANPDVYVTRTDLDRVEAAVLVDDEKSAGVNPRDGRVLLRNPNRAIAVNGDIYRMPAVDCCLDILADSVSSIEHDCVIVIENFEALIHFERLHVSGQVYENPLLVFRGDAMNPGNGALALAARSNRPVIAFADYDPKGLCIAASVPNVAGFILPAEFKWARRDDLFLRQTAAVAALAQCPPALQEVWATLRVCRRGMTQETMIARMVPCRYVDAGKRDH